MNLTSKKWNQGNISMNAFGMQRKQAAHDVTVKTPAGRLFDQTCVNGAPGWLPAGSARLSYADSGHNELNALWVENETALALFQDSSLETIWTTTLMMDRTRT